MPIFRIDGLSGLRCQEAKHFGLEEGNWRDEPVGGDRRIEEVGARHFTVRRLEGDEAVEWNRDLRLESAFGVARQVRGAGDCAHGAGGIELEAKLADHARHRLLGDEIGEVDGDSGGFRHRFGPFDVAHAAPRGIGLAHRLSTDGALKRAPQSLAVGIRLALLAIGFNHDAAA